MRLNAYIAHVVIGFVPEGGEEAPFDAHEDLILFWAQDAAGAERQAEQYGRELEQLEDGLEVDGVRAKRVFGGVRTVVELSEVDLFEGGSPLTYFEWRVVGIDGLRDYARNILGGQELLE